MANFLERKVLQPLIDLLKMGATPEKLAWSLAAGMLIGINPLLGSTTLVILALTGIFRLNLVASQIATHVVYPLELLLFPVFVRLGSKIFGTEHLPLHGKELLEAVHRHPLATTKILWHWEWHALVVWAAFTTVALPVLAYGLRHPLRHMLRQSGRDQPLYSSTGSAERTHAE